MLEAVHLPLNNYVSTLAFLAPALLLSSKYGLFLSFDNLVECASLNRFNFYANQLNQHLSGVGGESKQHGASYEEPWDI